MRGGSREPKPLKETLSSLLREIRSLSGEKGPLGKARAAWADLVGAAAASRTRVAALENGSLLVEVASSALKQDLSTFRREELLKGLRERVPEARIETLRFRVGTVA